jgi:hypothetical protein
MEGTGKKIQYNYSQRERIPKDFLCNKCGDPLIEPVEHESSSECEALYCKTCAPLHQCPSCGLTPVIWRDVLAAVIPTRFLLNPLNNLAVVCPACSNIFPRIALQDHLLLDCPIGMLLILIGGIVVYLKSIANFVVNRMSSGMWRENCTQIDINSHKRVPAWGNLFNSSP